MRGLLAIARRELAGLFLGPLAWILLALAWLLDGWLLVLYVRAFGGDVDVALRWTLGEYWVFWALVVLVPPLLTMRMISEESRAGTLEFLLTAPVTDAAVVTGKFVAAFAFMAVLWSSAFVYAAAFAWAGRAPDLGLVTSAWIGATLVSGLACAIGLFASALTDTPILSAFVAVVIEVAVLLAPLAAGFSERAGLRRWIARFDVLDHHRNAFLTGALDSAYVVSMVAWIAFFLFLAVRTLEARRWR